MLLGVASLRAGGKIYYDGAKGRVTTWSRSATSTVDPNEFLTRNYREGFKLPGMREPGGVRRGPRPARVLIITSPSPRIPVHVMNKAIRFKLILMMVLEFFIWGAWLR